jgi:hypothetical protein
MTAITHPAPVSRKRFWAGSILSALAVLFLLFDSVIKLIKIAPVVESFAQLGIPDRLAGCARSSLCGVRIMIGMNDCKHRKESE